MTRWQVAVCTAILASTWMACGADEYLVTTTTKKKSCKTEQCTATEKADEEAAEAARATDGVKSGSETDVDCGGDTDIARCTDGKACLAGTDCTNLVCANATCQPPSPTDTVKNGDETDVDCGGATAPQCAVGKTCKVRTDCESDGCGYDGKCALARSCAGHLGGDTCGAGDTGEPGAKHESCCAAAAVTANGSGALVDKYLITAGRFRQFVERTNGNLRAFAETLGGNPSWFSAWTAKLPTNIAEVNLLLGPTGDGASRRGCDLNTARARTYWMTDEENRALGDGIHTPATKDMLDEKALNCVDVRMLQAMCIWDGGRLATGAELTAAWSGGEDRAFPWGGNTLDLSRVVHKFGYQFPQQANLENFIYVAAPGRRPTGNGKFGHADLGGLLFPVTSDSTATRMVFFNAGSWENHAITARPKLAEPTNVERGYWAIGGRCARRK